MRCPYSTYSQTNRFLKNPVNMLFSYVCGETASCQWTAIFPSVYGSISLELFITGTSVTKVMIVPSLRSVGLWFFVKVIGVVQPNLYQAKACMGAKLWTLSKDLNQTYIGHLFFSLLLSMTGNKPAEMKWPAKVQTVIVKLEIVKMAKLK